MTGETEQIPPFDIYVAAADPAVTDREDVGRSQRWWKEMLSFSSVPPPKYLSWEGEMDAIRLRRLRQSRDKGDTTIGNFINAMETLHFLERGLNPWYEGCHKDEWRSLTFDAIRCLKEAKAHADILIATGE